MREYTAVQKRFGGRMNHRRKMRQKRSHGTLWVVITALFASCFIAYGAAQGVMGVIDSWLVDLPDVENSEAFNYSQKTRVYAADETTLLTEFYIENREPITLEQVNPYVLEGTVATEDERFYEHEGIDLMGIARAIAVNLTGGALEGASTITQQFIRNTILAEEATEISIERKVREAQLAIDLEKLYSKDEILLMYLNTINYGDGCWGIEAAAKNYFQKSAIDLTAAEAATLIGIPQSPTYLNPKTNPDACFERRNLVLSRMLRYGTINQEEYDAAVAEPLNLNPAPEKDSEGIYQFPYFTSYVRELLLEEFDMAKVFKGGLRVYTTIDPDMQYKAEAAAEQQYAEMDDDLAVSLTAIDPTTGYIKAMVGGKNYENSKLNLATNGTRHAGSSFKVFTLTSAIEKGIDPATKIDCSSPLHIGDWHPENYGGASYGIRTIQEATAISSNTGYVRLAQEITPEATVEMARRMGITTDDLKPLLSATLGAVGVTTMEMAGAYSTLATGGLQRDPVAITLITESNGEVVFQHEDSPTQVLTAEVSGAVTEVLKTVMQSGGTGAAAALPSGQVSAGKTGTSEDWRDRWLVGYTPQLVCATWIGNPDVERSMPSYLDCTKLWRNFMSAALEGQPLVDFPATTPPPYENPFNKQQSDLYDKKDPAEAPSAVGMTLEQAAELLDGYELSYLEEFSDTVAAGLIIRQEVYGEGILLYVSKGPDPNKPEPTPAPQPEETTPQPSP